MEKPIPSLSLAHPKPAAERFLTEMLRTAKWDHLFQVMGMIDYPVMPRDFHFVPEETIVTKGWQADGDECLVIFFTRHSEANCSTIVVGMKRKEQEGSVIWVPNSLFIDLYIRSEKHQDAWEIERCSIPLMRIS